MLTRRSLLRGVLSLAALGPLARAVVAEEVRQQQRLEFMFAALTQAIIDNPSPMIFYKDADFGEGIPLPEPDGGHQWVDMWAEFKAEKGIA